MCVHVCLHTGCMLAWRARTQGLLLDLARRAKPHCNVDRLHCVPPLADLLCCPPGIPPLQLLLNLAERAKLRSKMNAMFAGEHINNTEDRAVLHAALRMPRDEAVRACALPCCMCAWLGVQRLDSGPT